MRSDRGERATAYGSGEEERLLGCCDTVPVISIGDGAEQWDFQEGDVSNQGAKPQWGET